MAPVSNSSQTLESPKIVTCTAPVNIAVVKYWGKRNEQLILPTNDSISITLSSNQMHAKGSLFLWKIPYSIPQYICNLLSK